MSSVRDNTDLRPVRPSEVVEVLANLRFRHGGLAPLLIDKHCARYLLDKLRPAA